MKNILVPIGTSENAVHTLQYAVDFAKDFIADVYVMQAYTVLATMGMNSNVHEKVAQSSSGQMEEVIAQIDSKGVQIKILTYEGSVLEAIAAADKELKLDLIIMEPKSTDIRDELYLGKTSGSIIKQTDIPALIVPEGCAYESMNLILTAFKSGIVKNRSTLARLKEIKEKFDAQVTLLLVKTPGYEEEDLVIDSGLKELSTEVLKTDNATTFQGVLEHFQSVNPKLLCVFRRKRGFFSKLLEKNVILKRDFHCSIPLLVLSVKKY
ncbi:Nucleotide-binding universal stress protein, UspA family [Pustulibacterium marinum]|uniref:Nucleotide-binding universal stress protein, UspA family n=1 Tax=Pustulibacterium marinum TaxID=1224947 RepID=A0A1I7EVR7_9FLAO|nr:universal stress protein [Pustulibacterium marinum]SFU28002.1 Nucleotide-binding universal stress protein, UspA family [Pustulibacterium marinum]